MLSFTDAVALIIQTLYDFQRSPDTIRWYQAFYTSFFEFINIHPTMDDTASAFAAWKDENYKHLSAHRQKIASSAANALLFVMQKGHIPYHFFQTLPSKVRLIPAHYELLVQYMEFAQHEFSPGHLPNIESRCSAFLFRAQVHGICQISDLNYDFLQSFCEENNYSVSMSRGMVAAAIEQFLQYLASRSLVPYAYSLFINKNRRACLLDISEMSSADQQTLNQLRDCSIEDFPSEEFYTSSIDFLEILQNHSYESTVCHMWKTTSESLYLFLNWNNLGYEKVIVEIWYSYYQKMVSTSGMKMSRRMLKMYEYYIENGDIDPLIIFSYSPSSLDLLASWCKPTVEEFLTRKEREQKAKSTVAMYRSSIIRFCNWLDKNGVKAYSQITPDHIKRFDVEDPHDTDEGKAAYNSRIRQFLMYLTETGLVTVRLFDSVPTACASRERLVNVLTSEEISAIDEYIAKAETELELRDAAMIQLGLRMGLRSVDICGLKLGDIDWKRKAIHFIQQKTKVEVYLPMPVSVGNAIYRYLLKRSERRSDYVFLPVSKRGKSLTRAVCRSALHRALPEFRGGFHWLRKTFSTGLLNRGVSPTTISDALGHTSNSEQDRYLSLNVERMLLCPLHLSGENIRAIGRIADVGV